jgi:DNA-binding transcriptional MerR regulator
LLRPPQVVGRTGYYDEDHLARLELIREMQGDGFNLGAIGRLLEGVGDSSGEVLDFARAIRAPFEDEEPEIVDRAELTQRWGGGEDDSLFRRGEKLGLLRDLGDDKVEVISPRVIRAGAELAELGISLPTALDVAEKLRRESREVAKTFIELFLENVWKPFDAAGRPDEEWPQVREALERLRPLASESLLAIFGLVMTEATEKAFGRALERESKGDGRRQRSRSRRR